MATTQVESVVYAYQTEAGGWRVTGSRVSMDSVIHFHKEGLSPQEIVDQFPTLTLEQVYGGIAFYLHHREMMEQYLKRQQELWERERAAASERNRGLRETIRQRAAELQQKNRSQ